MGKYIRKSETAGEFALMEVSQSSLGVRTRAKALALQRLKKSSSSAAPTPPPADGGSYLQLRSRRLQKPPIPIIRSAKRKKQPPKQLCAQNPNPNTQNLDSPAGSWLRSSKEESGSGLVTVALNKSESENVVTCEEKVEKRISETEINGESDKDLCMEASFGENVLEIEGRERTTRESTPCSLIRDPETIRTPGSTTKPNNRLMETNRRAPNSSGHHLPTAHEMDQFFAGAEQEQQRQFIEKYNFDPVNEMPLPGRYVWEKVDH